MLKPVKTRVPPPDSIDVCKKTTIDFFYPHILLIRNVFTSLKSSLKYLPTAPMVLRTSRSLTT